MRGTAAFLLVLLALLAQTESKTAKSFTQVKDDLLKSLLGDRVSFSTPYIMGPTVLPALSEAKIKGLFPSWVHVNFPGNPAFKFLRNNFKFFDNNMFVTGWVMEILLEAQLLGIVDLSSDDLMVSLEAMLQNFLDQHSPPDQPIYSFWKQVVINGTYAAWPENLGRPLEKVLGMENLVHLFLNITGHADLWPQIAQIYERGSDFITAFKIPADFDDSSVCLGIGALLRLQAANLTSAYRMWASSPNANVEGFVQRLTQYAYRPFDSNRDKNSIDPRTYFWMHEFLNQEKQKAAAEGRLANLALVPTWVRSISEDRPNVYSGYSMPFHVNNVDGTVCANVLYGLASSLLSYTGGVQPSWFTPEVQQVYLNTSSLLAWILRSGKVVERPDLVLTYYPPIKDFYWFVSRSVFLLTSSDLTAYPLLATVRDMLGSAMREAGTQQLLSSVKRDGVYCYWDEFLGDSDTDFSGHPTPSYDDRLFSTSVAINALLDTWTTSQSGSLKWLPSTPTDVLNVVAAAAAFLSDFVLSGKYQLDNAFFSGSVKTLDTLPFAYPSNVVLLDDGTVTDSMHARIDQVNNRITPSMSGVVDDALYNQWLTATHFGNFTTPTTFKGFNTGIPFPYWTSPDMTKATALLALGKLSVIQLP
eukprot:TRINITY_DN12172_c0_g1_i3.p1 TRINITY_DN12172_c0_g1~~TRINITY_DN12172_c0_g1_i3.p1  ORF type:complete len:643 (+),score=195.28 TRINITY_DN12172_c0_g1_i3:79-2007(+)